MQLHHLLTHVTQYSGLLPSPTSIWFPGEHKSKNLYTCIMLVRVFSQSIFVCITDIIIIMIYVHIYYTMASNGINEYAAGPKMGNIDKMETSLRC